MEYQIISTKNKHLALVLDYQDIQEIGLSFTNFEIKPSLKPEKSANNLSLLANIHLSGSHGKASLTLDIDDEKIYCTLKDSKDILLFVVDCKNDDELMYQKSIYIKNN